MFEFWKHMEINYIPLECLKTQYNNSWTYFDKAKDG